MAQISTTQLQDDANTLGLTFEFNNVNGNVHVTGRTGDVIKVFAAQGADVTKNGSSSWLVTKNGEYVGDVLAGGGNFGAPATWALGRTACTR